MMRILSLTAALMFSSTLFAQNAKPFDPHDLTGNGSVRRPIKASAMCRKPDEVISRKRRSLLPEKQRTSRIIQATVRGRTRLDVTIRWAPAIH